MDLNLLELFVVVAEAASFSAAAKKLSVRRSSVSRGIAALERSLDVQLFSRTTRRVSLTTGGSALYVRVAPQLRGLHDSISSLPEREEQPSGVLRVSAAVDIGLTVLPGAIAAFTQRFPQVRVDLRLSNRMVDLVAEGFDAALRVSAARLQDSSLVARRLTTLEIQLFASPTYLARRGVPRSADDTADHDWIVVVPVPKPFPRPTPRVSCDDMLFAHRAAIAGLGLALLPAYLGQPDVTAGRLARVLPKVSIAGGVLHLVHPPAHHPPRKVSAFRDFLVEYLAAHPLMAA